MTGISFIPNELWRVIIDKMISDPTYLTCDILSLCRTSRRIHEYGIRKLHQIRISPKLFIDFVVSTNTIAHPYSRRNVFIEFDRNISNVLSNVDLSMYSSNYDKIYNANLNNLECLIRSAGNPNWKTPLFPQLIGSEFAFALNHSESGKLIRYEAKCTRSKIHLRTQFDVYIGAFRFYFRKINERTGRTNFSINLAPNGYVIIFGNHSVMREFQVSRFDGTNARLTQIISRRGTNKEHRQTIHYPYGEQLIKPITFHH